MKDVLIANKWPLLDIPAGTGEAREADTAGTAAAGTPRQGAALTRPVSAEENSLLSQRGETESLLLPVL